MIDSLLKFSPGDLTGHISYVLFAVSYFMRSIFWLRVMACVGLLFEIMYFAVSGGSLAIGIFWNTIFILINVFQLWLLIRDRFHVGLTEADRRVLAPLFAGLDRAQIAKIVKSGAFREYPQGIALTIQNRPVPQLQFILEGQAVVLVNSVEVASIRAGSSVGEIAFSTRQPASATVLTLGPVRTLSLDHVQLDKLCDSDEQIATAVYRFLNSVLSERLRITNQRTVAE